MFGISSSQGLFGISTRPVGRLSIIAGASSIGRQVKLEPVLEFQSGVVNEKIL